MPRAPAATSRSTRPRCTRRVRARSGRRPLRPGSRSLARRFRPAASYSIGVNVGKYGPVRRRLLLGRGELTTSRPDETERVARSAGLQLLRVPARLWQAGVFGARRTRRASRSARSCSACTRRSARRCPPPGLWQEPAAGSAARGRSGSRATRRRACARCPRPSAASRCPGSSSSQQPVDVAPMRRAGGQRLGRDRGLRPGSEDAGARRDGRGGQQVGYSKTVYVDNQQPTISLSGPSQARRNRGHPVRDRHRRRGAVGRRRDLVLGRRRGGVSGTRAPCPGAGQRRRHAHGALLLGRTTPSRATATHGVSSAASFHDARSACRP